MGSFLPICRIDVCSLEPVFLRFLFFLSGENFLTRPSNNIHEPYFVLNRTYENAFFPFFFFLSLFVHSFPRQSLSVRFGVRSQICGDSRTVRFSRLLCGLVTVSQKEELSVKGLLSIFYTGKVLDQPKVRCCLLWQALILFVTLRVSHIDKFLC